MRFVTRAAFGVVMLLMLIAAGAISAQDEETYIDPDGRFSFPTPAGWTQTSEGGIAHFVSPDGADLYVLAVAADDLQTGMIEGLAQVVPEVVTSPLQSSEIPVPGDITWTQNIYVLDGGAVIVAAIGRLHEGTVYLLAVRGTQESLGAATPSLNNALLGFAVGGETSLFDLLPPYVDESAYTESEIVVTSGDLQLPATLTLPNGEGDFPAVVLVHGSGPNDRDETLGVNKPLRDLALGLASQGIAVLRYDKRTFVYGRNPEAMAGLTIDAEVTDDALAAIDLLAQTEGIDPARIYVAGHSLGGMLASRIAERSGKLAGVIVLAGNARSFGEVVSDQLDYLETLGISRESTGLDGVVEGLAAIAAGTDPAEAFSAVPDAAVYWGSLAAVDQVAAAMALDLPFLVLQGERDYQVTMDDFALWQTALSDTGRATFISYPDLNHLFMAVGDLSRMARPSDYNEAGFVAQQVIDDIAEWIINQPE